MPKRSVDGVRMNILAVEPVYKTSFVTARMRPPATNTAMPHTTQEAFDLFWEFTTTQKQAHTSSISRERVLHKTLNEWFMSWVQRYKVNVLVVPDGKLPVWLEEFIETFEQDTKVWDRQRWLGYHIAPGVDPSYAQEFGRTQRQKLTSEYRPDDARPSVGQAYQRIASYLDRLPMHGHAASKRFDMWPILWQNWDGLTAKRELYYDLERILEENKYGAQHLGKVERQILISLRESRKGNVIGGHTQELEDYHWFRFDEARKTRNDLDDATTITGEKTMPRHLPRKKTK